MNKHPSDRENIDNFINENLDKKIVVVQGLGFVGSVMSIVVANSNDKYAVLGVDLPNRKNVIDSINNGDFPIQSSDEKVYDFFNKAKGKNTFYATYDAYAYEIADVVIVDINLDVSKITQAEKKLVNYSVDLSGFKKAIKSIASSCKQDILVLVETTVPPGTCQKIVKPIFDEEFEKRGIKKGFKIGHSYERVMPGPNYLDSIKNFYRVYSGINEESADYLEEFLHTIISTDEYPLTRLGSTNATEMSKVLENSYRAMNIAFIKEWTMFAESAKVNLHEVIDAIRMRPTHSNIMKPGLGVGGYCLTKDPLLASWSSQELFNSVKLNQSEKAVEINDQMPLHTFNVISDSFGGDLNKKKALILGVSYLQNVGDTRYTPVELLYDKLAENNVAITLNDPFVKVWEEKGITLDTNTSDLDLDILIIGTPHDFYFKENYIDNILNNCRKQLVVIDPHGVLKKEYIKKFKKHNFKIIGNGDV